MKNFILILALFAITGLHAQRLGLGTIVVTDSTSTWYLPHGAKVSAILTLEGISQDADSNQVFRPVITYQFTGGAWEIETEPWSPWQTVRAGADSLDYTQATWETAPESVLSTTPITAAKYCPVGCPATITYIQYRADEKSGTVQGRTQRRYYKFKPGESKFEKIIRGSSSN